MKVKFFALTLEWKRERERECVCVSDGEREGTFQRFRFGEINKKVG